MMRGLIFLLCPLLSTGVFAGDVVSVSVMEGDSVTLHADAKIKIDEIDWKFGVGLIASVDTDLSETSVDTEGVFGGRLQLDNQTGDLNITNIRISDSGEYKLQINRKPSMTFSVSVVPADPVKTVSVMEGDSVTLTGVTEILRYDVMQWRFEHENSPVAEINRTAGIFSTYDGTDGRFRDRLKLDYLTGSLTIRNIGTKHSGLYEVDISSSKHTIHKSFTVTVSGEMKSVLSVMEGRPVTLHTGLTEIQKDDSIQWMFGDTHIAEFYKADNRFSFNERFRGRLKLDDQTGSLTITDTTFTDSGHYELKIISSRRTIDKRFTVTVTDSGLSARAVAGICVSVLLVIVAAVAAVIYHRRRTAELKRERLCTLSLTEGARVTLTPHDIEIREGDHIQWKHEGTLIAERKGANGGIPLHDGDGVHDGMLKGRLQLDRVSGSLTITEAKLSDSGLYELSIIRAGHELLNTFIVYVCVRTLAVLEGESVTLNPHNIKIREDDHIQWKYKGTPIVEKKEANGEITLHDDVYKGMFKGRLHLDKKSGSLTIKEAKLTDSGRYELSIIRAGHELLNTFIVSVCDPNNPEEMILKRLFDSQPSTFRINPNHISPHVSICNPV